MREMTLSQCWYWFLLLAVVCYFIGCFNFAVLLAKARHKDIRKIGSGNPGTMNTSREFGLVVGFFNFLFDAMKGGLPTLAAYFIFRNYTFAGTDVLVSDITRYLAGASVVIGHIYPVTMKFKGGKGIAATFGVFWLGLSCENPWNVLIMLGAMFAVLGFIAVSEMGSMGSLLGVTAFSVWQGVIFYLRYAGIGSNIWLAWLFMQLLLINFLTWFSHRKNIVRLFAAEEHRTSIKKLHRGNRGMKNM